MKSDKTKLRWWQPKRRWLRMTLRTFLVLLTVACVWLGWLANRANNQRRTVQWATELGGYVSYDYQYHPEPPGPEWLRNLIGIHYFANVVRVRLSETQVRDVTPLANLTKLIEWTTTASTPVSARSEYTR